MVHIWKAVGDVLLVTVGSHTFKVVTHRDARDQYGFYVDGRYRGAADTLELAKRSCLARGGPAKPRWPADPSN